MTDPETPTQRTESRYQEVSRRAFLRRAARAAGALATLPLISSCSNDAAAFASASSTTLPTAASSTGAAVTTTTTPRTTTSESTTTTTTTTSAPSSLAASEMLIAFTYAASGGRVRNPYVAVWVEDEAGELVDTVALWFKQSQKGLRWLSDLRRWYSVDGSSATVDTVSSATRTPGSYQVAWDVTDLDGNQVPAGQYYVCIEAAREHGPYSLIREAITLAEGMAATDLADDGELSAASVALA